MTFFSKHYNISVVILLSTKRLIDVLECDTDFSFDNILIYGQNVLSEVGGGLYRMCRVHSILAARIIPHLFSNNSLLHSLNRSLQKGSRTTTCRLTYLISKCQSTKDHY